MPNTAVTVAQPGLRERKKQQMRQRISDTATALFLARGFDQVRVVDVATACEVAEKTIYNYFPTKESLVLDRNAAIADIVHDALGPGGPNVTPVEAIVGVIAAEIHRLFTTQADGEGDFRQIARYLTMIEEAPSLRAAQRNLLDDLVQAAAAAIADREGLDPLDPEPQAAARALIGIWAISTRALRREAHRASSPERAFEAVMEDTRRAARLIEAGLSTFPSNLTGRTAL